MKNQPLHPTYEAFPEAIAFSHKKTTQDASYAYHRHDGCEVCLFLSGSVKLYVEKNCYLPVPGSLVVISPLEMHRIQMMDVSPYERIVINVKQDYLDSLSTKELSLSECFYGRPPGIDNLRILSPAESTEFLRLFEGLATSGSKDCFGSPIVQKAYASLLLLFVNRQFLHGSSMVQNHMPPHVAEIMRYVENHLDEPLRLSPLSHACHLSESYLSAQFKLHTGLTLRAYQLDRKIMRAKELLRQGATVTDACFQSGFHDYANFMRSFKAQTGISPGKYADSLRNTLSQSYD